jgi:microcystin-dependent protein
MFMAAAGARAAMPPFQNEDPASAGNLEKIFHLMETHRHDNDGSGRLHDVLPESDSIFDLGASGREWANLYVDTITINGLLYAGNPVGTVVMYVNTTAPSGWLNCDGSAVSRTTYSRLFAVIGTTFGTGNGSTTFNLPDFRGVFPKGQGTTNRAAGVDASGNAYAATLGTYSQDKMQGHRHSAYHNNSVNWSPSVSFSDGRYSTIDATNQTNFTGGIGDPITDGTNGTPRTGHTTEPQSLGIVFIIYAGI